MSCRLRERLYSLVEDLGPFITWEVLQLQWFLSEEGYSQVKVVVPQLGWREKEESNALPCRLKNCFMTTSFSMRYGIDSFTVKSKGFNEMVTLVHLEAVPEEGEVGDLGHWPPECTLNQRTAVKNCFSAATIFHCCANSPAYIRIKTQRI